MACSLLVFRARMEILLAGAMPERLDDTLRLDRHRVTASPDRAEAMGLLSLRPFDLVVCTGADAAELLRAAVSRCPTADILVLLHDTGAEAGVFAAQLFRLGARDVLGLPATCDDIAARVRDLGAERVRGSLERTREAAASPAVERRLVGASRAIAEVRERAARFAESDAPVLVTGESGTGKELAARALHDRSARRARPFVALNCAAFPEALLEAELFGHERGAFTGAVRKRDGRFKAADGGTLFLDEVGELPLTAQGKLLRVLEDGCFEPLGTNQTIRVDVRIVSATNRRLKEMVSRGRFREDLYYRLKILELAMPPLRSRREDVPALVDHFFRMHGGAAHVSDAALQVLVAYDYPGNVRELEHAVRHAVALSRGEPEILPAHLPEDLRSAVSEVASSPAITPLGDALREFERAHLEKALAASGGRRALAARMLGISRKNLWEKMHRHKLNAGADAGDEPEEAELLPRREDTPVRRR